MESKGIFEVKTHLSAIIDRVEKGEEIIITRHGERVARIVPEKGPRNRTAKKRLTTSSSASRKCVKAVLLAGCHGKYCVTRGAVERIHSGLLDCHLLVHRR